MKFSDKGSIKQRKIKTEVKIFCSNLEQWLDLSEFLKILSKKDSLGFLRI